MKLRRKTLLVIGATILGLNAVLYTISSTLLLGNLTKAEEENTRQSLQGVLNVLTQTKEDFSARFADWAAWDDTYLFIQNQNPAYIESNLVPEALATLKINLALFVDSSGRIVFGTGFDLKEQKKTPIPPELQKHITLNDKLVKHSDPKSSRAGIVLLPNGPMLITSRPIVNSKGEGPIRGTLIFGRYLNGEGIEKLAKISRLSLSGYAVNDPQIASDFQIARAVLEAQGKKTRGGGILNSQFKVKNSILVQPLNSEIIRGYALLKDIYGKPALLLRVDIPRQLYRYSQRSQRYLIVSLLLTGLVFSWVTLQLLERMVLSRLARLSADVTSIGKLGDLSRRVLVAGKDELSDLSQTINRMLTALQHSQHQLKENEERHRAVIEQASEGIVLIDAHTHQILEANTAFETLLGYPSTQLLELTIDEIVADNSNPIDSNIKPVSTEHHLGELRYRRLDGSFVDVEVSANLISYGGREVLCSLVRDITERKRTEEQVHLLHTIMLAVEECPNADSAVQVILQTMCETKGWDYGEAWIPSLKDNVLKCSSAWYTRQPTLEAFRRVSKNITFAPSVGLPGRVWVSQLPEWQADVTSEPKQTFLRMQQAKEYGLKTALGIPLVAQNQVLVVLVFFLFTSYPPDQQLVKLLSAVASQLGTVIQRKQAEAAVRQAEEKYRNIFENAIEGIFQTTPDGNYLSANPALAKIYGYSSPEELITQLTNIQQQIYLNPNRREEFMAAMQEEDAVWGFESQVYRKDGSVIWISENARAVRDGSGTLLYYEGTVEDITYRKVAQEALRFQQEQTERLLLNILPGPIAERLKQQPDSIAESFAEVTVLFADIVGFTEMSENIPPATLVQLLNRIFSTFDQLAEKHGLEKIKTIGDAYMAVGGLPMPRFDHAEAIAELALDMQQVIPKFKTPTGEPFGIRIGINTGPVVAGVIGIKKFIYDLWGDTVNTASRMESHGIPGRIQVTAATYDLLCYKYAFEERGIIQVKGKGDMKTYLLVGKKIKNYAS